MNEYLKPFASFDREPPLKIELAGITYPDPAYRITRSDANIFVIEYVIDGEGYVLFDGEMHHVSADTVYLLTAGERHEYYADSVSPFSKIFLNVSGSLCEQLIMAYGLSGRHIFHENGVKAAFERILPVIASEMSEEEMQASLQGIFVEIISALSLSLSKTEHSDEAIRLKDYLDSNPERIVSSAELSKIIFRSSDYCQKLFKREFGITPYAYQLERKMQAARSLLADTQLSVGEIAERLGYSDIHYFSNLFRAKCGCRPLSYRKSRR